MDNDILVTCVSLNKCKNANVNGVWENILAIIHTKNIDLVDYLEVQETSNILFSFITESIHDISKFDIYLKNRKREHIKFMENEEKIP